MSAIPRPTHRAREIRTVSRSVLALTLAAGLARPTAAQTFDPQTQSPMTLMDVPADGVGYYHDKQRGIELLGQRRWADAEQLYARLTAEYPRDGMNWRRLG